MKKSQLRKIIKEEISKVLNETTEGEIASKVRKLGKENKKKTYISIPNEQAAQYENTLEEFDFLNDVIGIRERDFMTDFIFEDLNEVELATLEALQNGLK